jgi:hypothetical protein
MERVTNAWMKISRATSPTGSIPSATLPGCDALDRRPDRAETTILDAYRDFRGALKQAEVLALEVLSKAERN